MVEVVGLSAFWLFAGLRARAEKKRLGVEQLKLVYSPLSRTKIVLARILSELVSICTISVFIFKSRTEEVLPLEQHISLFASVVLHITTLLFGILRFDSKSIKTPRSKEKDWTLLLPLLTAVALVFAAGLVSSFSERSANSEWLWYPALHVTVFHAAVPLYLRLQQKSFSSP